MNPFKKLAGETAIYGLSSIIGRTLNFLLFPLYTHLFPPEEYGIINNLYAYVAFLLIFLTYGMETAFFRFSKKHANSNDVYSTSASSIFSSSLIFILLVVLFLNPITNTLGYPGKEKYILYLAIIVAIDAFTAIPFAYLRKENKALRFATLKLINIGINIGLNLLFFLVLRPLSLNNPDSFFRFLYNPAVGICYVFTSNLIANIIVLILLYPEIKKIKFRINFTLLKQMLKYALPILVVGFAGQINQNIDKILLKFLVPEGENAMHQIGVYGANYKIAIFMSLFIQAFNYSFEPFFFSQDDSKDVRKTYADIMKYFVILGWVIFLGVTLYIDLFKFLESSAYYEGLKIVPIILVANLLLGVYYNQSIWYKVTDKTKYGAYQSIIGALVTLIINFAFIPVIGYMASAIASVACYLVMVILSYIWGRKYYPINYDLKTISAYTIFALAIYFITLYIPYPSTLIKIICNTFFFAGFIIVVYLKEIKPLVKGRRVG
ncbi:oligosaccharide flippase family protein [Bacteroidales bacterium OttesenSCG-928-K03]|nr:oligosaccharide flippase family protein [Odoribacter sp. OttesenSCG-928-L07]MDL2239522.1 oligosaccharide flippase family protein [Bacteroidales bacterium OttesenSCG-928-L14]MDL2242215.1 oligosaccharide flippase family protein [Bacteroidales bacterium OttesenSCG-928-K03]